MSTHAIPATSPVLLRRALQLDAVVTGANGVGYLALAGVLSGGLDVPAAGLRGVGAFLLVFALGVGFVATRRTIPAGPVLAIVAINAVWAVESLAVLAAGWIEPTTLGAAWVVAQALVVGGFAALQAAGRRAAAVTGARAM